MKLCKGIMQNVYNRNVLNVCLDDEKWHIGKKVWFMDRYNVSTLTSPRFICTQNSNVLTTG